ncbi:LAFE_0E00826g1_1 [Lachancea fermentati]|uniref:LAFE_0E00826g1_1 n=1 Tax=Lachancea fermentati TaxID=4955 RepID=A0A1G4MCD8_LACFM|nr:LAFE_0E00826g1_1 [Lachancea fermentati]
MPSFVREPLRNLTSVEKRICIETINGERNGVVFSAAYSKGNGREETWNDDATLLTVRDQRLTSSLVYQALSSMIRDNVELFTTINECMQFEPVLQITVDDVIRKVEFESYKDELVNCHNGIPPYLLRHIFDKSKFSLGKQQPLWELFIVDETMVVFHGHDVLFDIFAAANFHKLFLRSLNSLTASEAPVSDCLFKYKAGSGILQKSIFENPKLHLPAIASDLFQLQTRAFFKSVYNLTVKKPLEFLESGQTGTAKSYQSHYTDILSGTRDLCGTIIFGNISPDRFQSLKKIINRENICLRSFICAIVLLCLKPLVRKFDGSITFSVPVDLRDSIPWSTPFGLYYKDILIDCPLSLINDRIFKGLNVYNGYDPSNVKPSERDPAFEESLLEYQFRESVSYVSGCLKQRMRTWERCQFNDDDIKRMKFTKSESRKTVKSKIIEINDVTNQQFCTAEEMTYHIKDVCLTSSRNSDAFMSISYCYSDEFGLNICIHYPEGYAMETFVECFQSFMEELSRIQ